MRSDLLGTHHPEAVTSQPGMASQNSKVLEVVLNDEVIAPARLHGCLPVRRRFQALGSGDIARYVQQRLTGERPQRARVRAEPA